jgi:hypothetical protein
MLRNPLLASCFFLALFCAPRSGFSADPGFGGEFKIGDVSHKVVDAIAFPHRDNIVVVLSEHPLDRGKLGEDGKIDSMDFFDAPDGLLKLDIDPLAGKLETLRSSSEGSYDIVFVSDATFELSHNDAERIAGRVKISEGPEAFFDLPITRKVERPGIPLPADGGAPGLALLAYVQAIHSGDFDALVAHAPAAQAERFRKAQAAGETEKLLNLARKFTPTDIVITGGRQDGDQAWVEFSGQLEGQARNGEGTLKLDNGRWLLEKISSRAQ